MSTLVLAMLCVCGGACKKGPPSRDVAARIITDELKSPELTNKVDLWLAYSTYDPAGATIAYRNDGAAKACLDPLIAAGLLTKPTLAAAERDDYLSRDLYVWTTTLTDAARPFLIAQRTETRNDWDKGFQATVVSVSVAAPEFLQVTGVTNPTGGMAEGFVQAQFTYRIASTPFGQALVSATEECRSRELVPDPRTRGGSVDFQKYDDGWRHGEPQGEYGMPINGM